MNSLSDQGIGIIMISSELPEILGVSDRILVFCKGKIAAVLDKGEATQELILEYAAGLHSA
jgi:ABC-type sugar transport system ATPase subunit